MPTTLKISILHAYVSAFTSRPSASRPASSFNPRSVMRGPMSTMRRKLRCCRVVERLVEEKGRGGGCLKVDGNAAEDGKMGVNNAGEM